MAFYFKNQCFLERWGPAKGSIQPLFEYFLEFVYDSLFNDGLSAPAHRMWTDFNPVCVTSTWSHSNRVFQAAQSPSERTRQTLVMDLPIGKIQNMNGFTVSVPIEIWKIDGHDCKRLGRTRITWDWNTVVSYQFESFSSKWELPSLLSPSFITRGSMEAVHICSLAHQQILVLVASSWST